MCQAKAPMAPVAVPYNWTGLYIGLTAGYGWGRYTQFADPLGDGPRVDPKGFVGGGTYWLQLADEQLAARCRSRLCENGPRGSDPVGTASPVFTCGLPDLVGWTLTGFGTVRGRLGITSAQWLFYATGGLAYGRFDGGIDNSVATTAPPKSVRPLAAVSNMPSRRLGRSRANISMSILGAPTLASSQPPCSMLRGAVSTSFAAV